MCCTSRPRSSTRVLRPWSHSSFAAQPPEIPEPMTIASYVRSGFVMPTKYQHLGPISRHGLNVYTLTAEHILPCTITGSWPRPRWFDLSMWGRPIASCMMDVRYREKFQDAMATVLSDQERAGIDIL